MRNAFSRSFVGALLAFALLLAGCGPMESLAPLYVDSDKQFEAALVGEWRPQKAENDDEKNSRWIFLPSKQKEGAYAFSLDNIGKPGGFLARARLVKLGDFLFIDFIGEAEEDNGLENFPSVFPVMSVHMFGRIWIENDSVRIHFLSDSWVSNQIKAGKFELSYNDASGSQVLTVTTQELRAFALKHAKDEEAFSENFELARMK